MKIAIVTMHRVFNYGSVIQTYALSKYLEEQGHDIEIIDYIAERFKYKNTLFYVNPRRNKSMIHKLFFITVALPGRLMHKHLFESFIKRSYKLTQDKYYSIEELIENPPEADVYITGSDQVWNSGFENKVDRAYFLDFVPKNKKRISYAGSFGKEKLEECESEEIKELINKYDKISVREDSAISILESIGRNDAIHVVDPTLLLDREEWDNLSSERLRHEKYLLIYQLNPNEKIIEYARKIAIQKGLKIAKFGWDYIKPKGVDINFAYRKPEDFLSAIKYADYIVTDSFHGTIFSIKFNRQFICIEPPKYSGRLYSILRKVGLEERMIRGSLNINKVLTKIDYEYANIILKNEQKKAKDYLYDALNN